MIYFYECFEELAHCQEWRLGPSRGPGLLRLRDAAARDGGVAFSGPGAAGGPGRGPGLGRPCRPGGRGTVARRTRAAGFTHVVRYGRTSAIGAETPSLLDEASHGPAGRWVLLRRLR